MSQDRGAGEPREGGRPERVPEIGRRDVAREASEEMRFHIETRAERYIESGLSREEALARARSEFGDGAAALAEVIAIDERSERRRRRAGQWDSVRRDVRYAVRRLIAAPGFTGVAVLTLALGIGANSAIFSVVNGVLLRPLPFADADRLAMVWNDNQRISMRTDITSWPAFEDWRTRSRSFARMAGYSASGANLAGDFGAERVMRAQVSEEFFEVLGVSPVLGRGFTAEEMVPNTAPVVVLSHAVWQQRFGGARDVIGRSVRVNGAASEVVGVMPSGFDFPDGAGLWAPLRVTDGMRQSRGSFFLYVVGRLAAGTNFERAQSEMNGVAAALAEEYPQNSAGMGIFVQPMRTHLVGDARPALLVLLGAVGLVLLIACANVANLLLSRATSRHREVAVRLALGAGRGQVVRQLLTESLVIGLLGGGVGLGLAIGGVALLHAGAGTVLPRIDQVSVDAVVLGFTLLLSLLTGLLFGLVPSLQVAGGSLTAALREEARGTVSTRTGGRTRGLLVVAELAVSLILLVGAGLLLQSFVRLNRVDTGFRSAGVLTARIALRGPAYNQPAAALALYDRLFERLRALPGVQQVAAGSNILLEELPWSAGFTVEGHPPEPDAEQIELTIDAVTPGYFHAVGTPLRLGRDVRDDDRDGALPVAIVNQAMVRRYWPSENPLGKRFKLGGPNSNQPWLTVIGVAGDARRTSQEQEARPSAYLPLRQLPVGDLLLILRSSGDPLAQAAPLREAVRSLDPDVPVSDVQLLESILHDRLAQRRLTTGLAGLFTFVAVGLALIGVYGVLSYAVSQGTREIGVRIALGASVATVLGLVYRRVAGLIVAGLTLGVLGALFATRTLTSLLFDVRALDPVTFMIAPVLLGAVALLACYVPARRATRVDPAVALRVEN